MTLHAGGKTYTMMGEKSNGVPGLVDLCVDQLFSSIDAQSEKDYMVRVSYIEIYNESVRDLLNPTAADNLKHNFTSNDDLKGFTARQRG